MGQHFYTLDGTPAHTQPNKSKPGERRDTTLADAKKLGLLPSVSAYLSMLSQPGLVDWKLDEAVKAAAADPCKPGEEIDEYVERILLKSSQQVRDAADLGTRIHAAIEQWFTAGSAEDVTLSPYVEAAVDAVSDLGVNPLASEKVLVNAAYGYAGTTDLIFNSTDGCHGILDFKSKRTKPGQKIFKSDSHRMQIAAYWAAQFGPDFTPEAIGYNIYISTTEPGRVDVVKYTVDDLIPAWEAFKSSINLYRFVKGYDARNGGAK